MNTKKILTLIIALAILIPTVLLTVYADDINFDDIVPMPMPTVPVLPQYNQESEYAHIDGTITEIKDFIGTNGKPVKGKQIVRIEKDESVWNAVIDSGTYFITVGKPNKKSMSVGDDIRVFYNAKNPMILIYPPQFNAEFAALNLDEATSVTIGRFDENFIDSENNLKLNIADTTEIVYEDGKIFEGETSDLVNRKIVVVYSVTTKSIPAITTPEKIIIMYEKAVAPIYILTDEEKSDIAAGFAKADIVLNGQTLKDAPKAFMNDDGILMVPMRAIAEGIGFEVSWIGETKTVNMGRSLTFTIGKDEYKFSGHDPISLGTAPVLKNDRTYVPISLFENMPFGKVIVKYYLTENTLNIDIHIPAIGG